MNTFRVWLLHLARGAPGKAPFKVGNKLLEEKDHDPA
jgi:hypothetical protein